MTQQRQTDQPPKERNLTCAEPPSQSLGAWEAINTQAQPKHSTPKSSLRSSNGRFTGLSCEKIWAHSGLLLLCLPRQAGIPGTRAPSTDSEEDRKALWEVGSSANQQQGLCILLIFIFQVRSPPSGTYVRPVKPGVLLHIYSLGRMCSIRIPNSLLGFQSLTRNQGGRQRKHLR